MEMGRFCKVPNRPIQGSTGHPNLCTCHSHLIVLSSHVLMSQYKLYHNRSEVAMSESLGSAVGKLNRRSFIGGSDARIIMGDDEAALLRLWREKRGEVEPEDLSGNLIVQLGIVTEDLNRRWYEANTGQVITDVQKHVRHPGDPLDGGDARRAGRIERRGVRSQIHAALVFLGGGGSRKIHAAAAAQYVGGRCPRRRCSRSSPAAASGLRSQTHADPLYQHLIVTAERKFWRCVESGEPPRLFGIEPPKPRIEAVRIVDMSASNAWAEFAAVFARTRSAHLEHEQAKAELKSLVPEDAKQAIGHGIRAKRSKSGADQL